MSRTLAVLLVSCFAACPLFATEFGEAELLDASLPGPVDVRVGDMDGDGDLDVVSASAGGDQLTLHRNVDGSAHLWQGLFVCSTPEYPKSLALADLDGDDDLDICAGTGGSSTDLGWLFWVENDAGDGTSWTVHELADVDSEVTALTAADLDGDGDVDILYVLDQFVRWIENVSGDGSTWAFRGFGAPLASGGCDVDVADLDGDDDLDVLFATSSEVVWLENLVGDASSWSDHTVSGAVNVTSVRPGDLDGDDDLDLLVSIQSPPAGRLVTLENKDGVGGSWSQSAIDPVVLAPYDAALADVDGDGDLDAVCVSAWGQLQWNENGNGWQAHLLQPSLLSSCLRIVPADLDGDGDMDVVAPNWLYHQVVWWEQLTWFDLGQGLAGALGEPRLLGSGKLLAGETVVFSVSDAFPLSSANFVIGVSELALPFRGGTMVPNPDLVVFGIPTSFGSFSLPLVWPSGVPNGFATWYQLWVADGTAPAGFSATNALEAVAP